MNIYERIVKERDDILTPNHPEERTIGATLREYMGMCNVRVKDLAVLAWVDPGNTYRLLNNKLKHPHIELMIALCIGLQLSYEESMKFLSDSGYYNFETSDKIHNDMLLYSIILKIPQISILDANIILLQGINQIIEHAGFCNWRPSFLPSDKVFIREIRNLYPEFTYSNCDDLIDALYHNRQEVSEVLKIFKEFRFTEESCIPEKED